jgi:hypothetical protein
MGVGTGLRLDFGLAEQTAERLPGFAITSKVQQPASAGQEMVVQVDGVVHGTASVRTFRPDAGILPGTLLYRRIGALQ